MKHVPTCRSEGRPSAVLLHISDLNIDVEEQRLHGRKRLPNKWITTTHGSDEWQASSYIGNAGGRRCDMAGPGVLRGKYNCFREGY